MLLLSPGVSAFSLLSPFSRQLSPRPLLLSPLLRNNISSLPAHTGNWAQYYFRVGVEHLDIYPQDNIRLLSKLGNKMSRYVCKLYKILEEESSRDEGGK